jgi:hypothetical protein
VWTETRSDPSGVAGTAVTSTGAVGSGHVGDDHAAQRGGQERVHAAVARPVDLHVVVGLVARVARREVAEVVRSGRVREVDQVEPVVEPHHVRDGAEVAHGGRGRCRRGGRRRPACRRPRPTAPPASRSTRNWATPTPSLAMAWACQMPTGSMELTGSSPQVTGAKSDGPSNRPPEGPPPPSSSPEHPLPSAIAAAASAALGAAPLRHVRPALVTGRAYVASSPTDAPRD